jgi:hypothetical protein
MCCFHISEFKTQVSITDSFFIETIHDDESPYISEHKILKREKNAFILFNESSNMYNGGKHSHLHYFNGKISINSLDVKFFAFYFGSYDKKTLLDVRVPREKEIAKYTFCVQHKVGDNSKTVDQHSALAKQVKDAYIEMKKQKIKCK